MRRSNNLKQHIISMRVSADEWESLREAMQHLQVRRVSDLMREALTQILVPHSGFDPATVKGADKAA